MRQDSNAFGVKASGAAAGVAREALGVRLDNNPEALKTAESRKILEARKSVGNRKFLEVRKRHLCRTFLEARKRQYAAKS